jgi:hypothetical protein
MRIAGRAPELLAMFLFKQYSLKLRLCINIETNTIMLAQANINLPSVIA